MILQHPKKKKNGLQCLKLIHLNKTHFYGLSLEVSTKKFISLELDYSGFLCSPMTFCFVQKSSLNFGDQPVCERTDP